MGDPTQSINPTVQSAEGRSSASVRSVEPPPIGDGTEALQNLEKYILVRRSALPGYYLVLVACTLGAFLGGWLARGSFVGEKTPPKVVPQERAERVLVSGQIRFLGAGGIGQPDRGAVVMLLPAERLPPKPLPVEGLRPWDEDSALALQNREKVAEFGGAWGKADAQGEFSLVLPTPGQYWVLVISRNLARPRWVTEQPHRGIAELDREQLARYFERPVDLIGPQDYRWTLEKLDATGLQINQVFTRIEQLVPEGIDR